LATQFYHCKTGHILEGTRNFPIDGIVPKTSPYPHNIYLELSEAHIAHRPRRLGDGGRSRNVTFPLI